MIFEIHGSFVLSQETDNIIKCDEKMFQDYWENILYVGIVEKIDNNNQQITILLKYQNGDSLEYYGDYALISFNKIKPEHLNNLKRNHILVYNDETKLLHKMKNRILTKKEKIEKDKKLENYR